MTTDTKIDPVYCMDDYQMSPQSDSEWEAWFAQLRETATKYWGADFELTMQLPAKFGPEYPRLKRIGASYRIKVMASTAWKMV